MYRNCCFVLVLLGAGMAGAQRFKVPGSVCGRPPLTFECDALPVGVEETEPDNGTQRSPSTCTPGQYCQYGMVTYAFGRNQYAQLGVGDFRDRNIPTPLATAYAKVDKLAVGAQFNILRWEGVNTLYAWGRDDYGQLGMGVRRNDTLPQLIPSLERPVEIKSGYQHTIVTMPPVAADLFSYDDFAGYENDFVHYGDSLQPYAPSGLCPCITWEKAPQPHGRLPHLTGLNCYAPSWGADFGVPLAGRWCFVGTGEIPRPCQAAQKVTVNCDSKCEDWWVSGCSDLAKFVLTPDPPGRLKAGAVWRKEKVQVYQAWRMNYYFHIKKSDVATGGGDGIVFVIQNHGIEPRHNPIGGPGQNLGIARTGRYRFDLGIPNALGIELRTTPGDGALEVRSCFGQAYTSEDSGEFARCQQAISFWKPQRECSPFISDSCCTDAQITSPNSCFTEDVVDEGAHEIIIIYSPFQLKVYVDDPRTPKIIVDFDIREHIRSYKCSGGPNDGHYCSCSGDPSCGSVEDTASCGGFRCITDGTAWMGFTSSTGDSFSVHEIISWSFINLGQDGGVLTFGKNLHGQLGLGDNLARKLYNLITPLDTIRMVALAGGEEHSMALSSTGAVYTWGGNSFGQLGQGDLRARSTPTKVRVLDSMSIAAASGDPCVCGPVTRFCAEEPRRAPCTFRVVGVSAGAFHSLAVVEREDGAHEIWGWGDNNFGQLGCIEVFGVNQCPWPTKAPGTLGNWPNQATLDEPCSGTNIRCMATPRRLTMFDRFGVLGMVFKPHQLVSGAFHNVLITADCPECPMPERCTKDELTRDACDCDGGFRKREESSQFWTVESIECIAKDRELFTWGANLRGQLGNNCSDNAHHGYQYVDPALRTCPDSPVVLRLNSNRKIHLLPYYPDLFPYLPGNETTGTPPLMAIRPEHISVGQYHNLLLMDNGALYVWGANYFGQLGLGDLRMRVMPTVVPYFVGRTDPAPHISPLDGLGRSIATRPRDAVTAQRRIKLAEAGEHHTVVVADCYGGGFKPDGSCDCKRGWKGVDCDIQCAGGENHSCSFHGTFDTSNRNGDRETCRAYLAAKAAAGEWNNNGKCVGLKTSQDAPGPGCPGDGTRDCPTECSYCDEELYDCENDGSCICSDGFTGGDCGFNCLPKPGQYFFLQPVGDQAICDCDASHTGMYCNGTIADTDVTVETIFTSTARQLPAARSGLGVAFAVLLLLAGQGVHLRARRLAPF